MKTRLVSVIMLIAIILASAPSDLTAGRYIKKKVVKNKQKKTIVKKKPAKRTVVVTKLPAGHKKIIVHKNPFYFTKGVWYKKGSSGYVVVRAPLGARIKALPIGYTVVVRANIKYYHYYGAYYKYDPDNKEYYVVEALTEVQDYDVITLTDGEILKGCYLGGNEETVEFQVDEDVYVIDISDIESILYEPPSD